MARRFAIAALIVTSISFAGIGAHADNLPYGGGCYVTGDVNGYRAYLDCTYVAQTGTQTVYVATHDYWRTYVVREVLVHTTCRADDGTFYPCDKQVDQDIVLADGYGPLLDGSGNPRTPGLIQIHPNVGETVHVEMYADCLPELQQITTCGKLGAVGAYE
jgi:hypothetical protein